MAGASATDAAVLGHRDDAVLAYDAAIAVTTNDAERTFLRRRRTARG